VISLLMPIQRVLQVDDRSPYLGENHSSVDRYVYNGQHYSKITTENDNSFVIPKP
jgi:hypothetical protein